MSRSMTACKDPAERQGYLRFFYRGWRPRAHEIDGVGRGYTESVGAML